MNFAQGRNYINPRKWEAGFRHQRTKTREKTDCKPNTQTCASLAPSNSSVWCSHSAWPLWELLHVWMKTERMYAGSQAKSNIYESVFIKTRRQTSLMKNVSFTLLKKLLRWQIIIIVRSHYMKRNTKIQKSFKNQTLFPFYVMSSFQ